MKNQDIRAEIIVEAELNKKLILKSRKKKMTVNSPKVLIMSKRLMTKEIIKRNNTLWNTTERTNIW